MKRLLSKTTLIATLALASLNAGATVSSLQPNPAGGNLSIEVVVQPSQPGTSKTTLEAPKLGKFLVTKIGDTWPPIFDVPGDIDNGPIRKFPPGYPEFNPCACINWPIIFSHS